MGNKKFARAALNLKHETLVVCVAALSVNSANEVHPSKRAQITHLKADKAAPTKVLSKYADFADVFLAKLATKLPEYARINNHAIKFLNNQ